MSWSDSYNVAIVSLRLKEYLELLMELNNPETPMPRKDRLEAFKPMWKECRHLINNLSDEFLKIPSMAQVVMDIAEIGSAMEQAIIVENRAEKIQKLIDQITEIQKAQRADVESLERDGFVSALSSTMKYEGPLFGTTQAQANTPSKRTTGTMHVVEGQEFSASGPKVNVVTPQTTTYPNGILPKGPMGPMGPSPSGLAASLAKPVKEDLQSVAVLEKFMEFMKEAQKNAKA